MLALELKASGAKDGLVQPVEIFAANLRKHRTRLGLSQEGLASASGLHFTEVSRLERGKREPKLTTLVRLADALDISLSELLGGIGR